MRTGLSGATCGRHALLFYWPSPGQLLLLRPPLWGMLVLVGGRGKNRSGNKLSRWMLECGYSTPRLPLQLRTRDMNHGGQIRHSIQSSYAAQTRSPESSTRAGVSQPPFRQCRQRGIAMTSPMKLGRGMYPRDVRRHGKTGRVVHLVGSRVQNGLALCSLHHKAFDFGAIGLEDDGLRIRVSSRLNGHDAVAEQLVRYAGANLLGPHSEGCRPGTRFIAWHNSEVFQPPPRWYTR